MLINLVLFYVLGKVKYYENVKGKLIILIRFNSMSRKNFYQDFDANIDYERIH